MGSSFVIQFRLSLYGKSTLLFSYKFFLFCFLFLNLLFLNFIAMKQKATFIALAAFLAYSCSPHKLFKTGEEGGESNWESALVKPVDFEYADDSAFTILSWNVEHFVDSHNDPYIDNEREDSPPENMPLRVNLLLNALKKADADIVLLQEFESAKYLQQLANDSLAAMAYKYFADVPSHGWYMNVVVMSKFPMGIITGYGAATTPLPGYTTEEGKTETQNNINSRMWSIDVFPSENYSFLLTGVHLKAGKGERNIAMRKGQLSLLAAQFNRMLQENPTKNMILAGDLNAIPISEEIGMMVKGRQLKIPFVDAIDTAIYSHPANKPNRRLDYILVNQNMYPEALPNSIKVQRFFSPDTMRIISDHLPITGTFYNRDKIN